MPVAVYAPPSSALLPPLVAPVDGASRQSAAASPPPAAAKAPSIEPERRVGDARRARRWGSEYGASAGVRALSGPPAEEARDNFGRRRPGLARPRARGSGAAATP